MRDGTGYQKLAKLQADLGADYLKLAEEVLGRLDHDDEAGRVAALRAELVPA